MQIQVVEIGNPVAKISKANKPFTQIQVDYVAEGRPGKTQLTSYSKAYKPLAASQPGDLFDIETVVNGAYTNWEGATPAGKAEPTAVKQAATAVKSTYETAEERARKQVLIVRQSSLSSAVAYYANDNGAEPEEIIDTAKIFEAYVFGDEGETEKRVD